MRVGSSVQRAKASPKLFFRQEEQFVQFQGIQFFNGAKARIDRRFGFVIPGTYILADVATEDPIAHE